MKISFRNHVIIKKDPSFLASQFFTNYPGNCKMQVKQQIFSVRQKFAHWMNQKASLPCCDKEPYHKMKMVDDSEPPCMMIPPSFCQEEELPTAKFLTSCFSRGDPQTFFCAADDDNTPRHLYEGDIKSSEKNDEWKPAASYAHHGSGRRAATTDPSREEARITRFSSASPPQDEESGSYADHRDHGPSPTVVTSMERSCTRSPVFSNCRDDKPSPPTTSSIAIAPCDLQVELPKLYHSTVHNATHSFSFANNTSSIILIDDSIVGKSHQYHSQQQRAATTTDPPLREEEARITRFSSGASQEDEDFGSYPPFIGADRREHGPSSPSCVISMERTCTLSPVFSNKFQSDKHRPSIATNAGDLHSYDLPKLNLAPKHKNATNSFSFPNTTSSIITIVDSMIGGKSYQYHPQQRMPSNTTGNTAFNVDIALLDDITCNIVPNIPRELVTGFTYAVICQFVKATFAETDRKGNRSKIPIGYFGFKCKHCEGKGVRTGRYFPSSLKSFADPMKSLQPMHRHLMKCKKCPYDTKSFIDRWHGRHEMELKGLKSKRNEGGQISFYRQIWKSLHPVDVKNEYRRCWPYRSSMS
jgi:hypothetical protein